MNDLCTRSAVVGALSALLAVPLAASAQDRAVRVGALGGVTFANVTDDDPDVNPDRISAPTGGLTLEFRLTDELFLDARGLWMKKGTKLPVPGIEQGVRAEITYVSAPLLLKFKGGDSVRPYLAAGPEVAFKTDAKLKATIGGVDQEEDIDDDVKSTDFAVQVVGGLEFSLDRLSFFLEGGYSHGLTNIDDTEDGESKTRTILVVGGLRF